MNRPFEPPNLILDGKVENLDRPYLVHKLMKSNKIKDYLKVIKQNLVKSSINNYVST